MNTVSRSISDATPQVVRDEQLVRVYVWQMPVRISHWIIFFSIMVLSFTGYYLYNPFIISRGNSLFLMARMRFIHEVTAFVFIAAVAVRFYWFFEGNRWAHWRCFVPVEQWWQRGLWRQLKFYLFWGKHPDSEVGHNPLAAATYLAIYALMVIEIVTGLTLLDYTNGIGHGLLSNGTGWLSSLIGIQFVRETHFLLMFVFLAFLIHHVYSAVLIGIEERSGLMAGIFSGYKFFPAAFVASDPTRRPHEKKIPAVPAGRSHKLRTGKRSIIEQQAFNVPKAQAGKDAPTQGEK